MHWAWEGAGLDGLEAVVEHLQGRRVLLVLDNCEHVLVGAFGLVEALLRACPPLTVLATSREPLAVSGEIVVPVPPLALPPPGSGPAELASSSAVVLFCQRGRVAQAGFELTVDNAAAVEQICRRLDGIPLALELAAARLRAAASQVAARLDDRFDLLTSGGRAALPRQQTLRAAMDWSYRLLAPEEQAALHALTVFPADFDLDAAAAVVGADGDDLVFRLVDKSLVTTRAGADEMRYSLLEQYGPSQPSRHTRVNARQPGGVTVRISAGWSPAGLEAPVDPGLAPRGCARRWEPASRRRVRLRRRR